MTEVLDSVASVALMRAVNLVHPSTVQLKTILYPDGISAGVPEWSKGVGSRSTA